MAPGRVVVSYGTWESRRARGWYDYRRRVQTARSETSPAPSLPRLGLYLGDRRYICFRRNGELSECFSNSPNRAAIYADTALIIRDQFQEFAVEGLNFSVCFSAKPDYFPGSIASPSLPFASTANSFWHRSHLMKRSNTPKRCSKRKRMFNLSHSGSTRRHSAIRISSRSSAVNCSPVGTTLPRSFGLKFLPS
jgi:hypothetical protein